MYNFKSIEEKWQKYWEDNETFKTDVYDFSKPKYYVLDMFPYPSGVGLHCGHVQSYTPTDLVKRMKKMQGFNVLHPMGWDAFGLPAEQYAIDTGNHPDGFTETNIATMKNQMKMLGLTYDWSKEISTTDPKYYKWTQWIFKLLFEDGLATQVDMPVNWCEELGTVLANDEVIDGKSERGGYPVIRKNMKQWIINLPKYAERLLSGLEEIDWPESTKEIQRNWIGKSIGASVKFNVADTDYNFEVFTTRSDTLFGATYCVLAPEHELVDKITTTKQKSEVEKYKVSASSKSELERTELNKDKTGVFTGSYAINPANNKKIPIWISDYVLASYGTGAIMAVPAHDIRDYEFAKKYGLDIIPVIMKVTGEPNSDAIFKKSIVAVVYDPKKDKYLTINWGDKGGRLFIGGSKEEDECSVECAIREIKEETGYTDIKLLHTSFPVNHHYFAHSKNQAFEIICDLVYFELLSDKQEKQNLEDHEKFKVEWVDSEICINEVKDELHATAFEFRIDTAYVGDGIHINSDFINGLNNVDAINKMNEWLVENNHGAEKVNYKVREWIFARQRYWGEPIPIVHFEDDTMKVLKTSELPLILPKLDDYKPNTAGDSPLAKATGWVNIEYDGKPVKRETSTMPGSAGSSWYWLRYLDPHNNNEIADKKLLEHWLPVDLYIGGPEHVVGHLLYSRMWNNYLYDKGIVPVKEPFKKLVHQGMVLGANNLKMGKRYPDYNINPTDVIEEYGADTLRLYEMFMGPLEADKPWNNDGVDGAKRFLDRVWRLFTEEDKIRDEVNKNLETLYNKTVKKVTEDYEMLRINTAISQMMIFINAVYKESIFPKEYAEGFIKLLNPIAPFITEEIWNRVLGYKETIANEKWPTYDDTKIIDNIVTIAISVNGKLRATIDVEKDTEKCELLSLAYNQENVIKHIQDKEIIKEIVIPNKIVNIVVK